MFTIHQLDDLTPDMINSAICNIIHEAEKHLPQSKFNTYAKPYWCSELKHAHARARHFRSVWLRSGRPRGGQHQSYSDYKLAKKSFRRLQRQCIAKYENSIFDQLNKAADTDFKLFWKLLRRQGGSRSEICNCLVVNGHSYSDSNVVEGFFHHFSSVFSSNLPEDELSPDLERELSLYERLPSTVLNQFLLNPLEVTELEGAIGSLPCTKSPGHDCMYTE